MPYHQAEIIVKLKTYLAAKGDVIDDRMDAGLCAGLVAYWLYAKANGEEGSFLHKLQYISDWNAEKLRQSGRTIDMTIEQFLNVVLSLHNTNSTVPGTRQIDLDVGLNLLLNQYQDKVSTAEFSISFLFNKQQIIDLIVAVVRPNKMIRISNGLHVIGLMLSDAVYTLYDPESTVGAKEFKSPEQLANEIFVGLSKFCKSKNYLAMNLMVFDLETNKPAAYSIDPDEYYRMQLLNPAIKKEAMQHKYLFYLLAKFNDFDAMDLLFANGYVFNESIHYQASELSEAISYYDEKKIAYLLSHDIAIDPKTNGILTPAAAAITTHNNKMLFELLLRGANPNKRSMKNKALLEIALMDNNYEAIVLLLVSGMELSAEGLDLIHKKFTTDITERLFEYAIEMQHNLLKLPAIVNLDSESGSVMYKLLQHLKLVSQLECSLDRIKAQYHKRDISGQEVINVLLDIYNNESISDKLHAVDKSKMYKLLMYFFPNLPEHNSKQLLAKMQDMQRRLVDIVDKFTEVPFEKHSKDELLEIQTILENIHQLRFMDDDGKLPGPSVAENRLQKYLDRSNFKAIGHSYNMYAGSYSNADERESTYTSTILPALNRLKH